MYLVESTSALRQLCRMRRYRWKESNGEVPHGLRIVAHVQARTDEQHTKDKWQHLGELGIGIPPGTLQINWSTNDVFLALATALGEWWADRQPAEAWSVPSGDVVFGARLEIPCCRAAIRARASSNHSYVYRCATCGSITTATTRLCSNPDDPVQYKRYIQRDVFMSSERAELLEELRILFVAYRERRRDIHIPTVGTAAVEIPGGRIIRLADIPGQPNAVLRHVIDALRTGISGSEVVEKQRTQNQIPRVRRISV